MDANLNAMEGANSPTLVLAAQHCVAADVKIRLRFNPEHRLLDYTCTFTVTELFRLFRLQM